MFFRNDFPYHIGDHLLAGRTEDMYALFNNFLWYIYDILKSNNGQIFKKEIDEKKWSARIFDDLDSDFVKLINLTHADMPPEVKLCSEYISHKENRQIFAKEHLELTKKYFKAFDVRKFKEFCFVANSIWKDGFVLTHNQLKEDGSFLLETPKCTSHKGPDRS